MAPGTRRRRMELSEQSERHFSLQLIQEDGIYRNFVLEREKTTNWKL